MTPFEVRTRMTEQEFVRHARALFSAQPGARVLAVVLVVGELAGVVTALGHGPRVPDVILLALLPAWLAVLALVRHRQVQRAYRSNRLAHDAETVLRFWPEGVETSTRASRALLRYDELYDGVVTRATVYLKLSSRQALVVPRAGLTAEQDAFATSLRGWRRRGPAAPAALTPVDGRSSG